MKKYNINCVGPVNNNTLIEGFAYVGTASECKALYKCVNRACYGMKTNFMPMFLDTPTFIDGRIYAVEFTEYDECFNQNMRFVVVPQDTLNTLISEGFYIPA